MSSDREEALRKADAAAAAGNFAEAAATRALLYDLGAALESAGEPARALAVFMELRADAPKYRDVAGRVARLSREETGG